MGIFRLGYVEFRSLDLERDLKFWCDGMGLVETARTDDKVYLKCWDEQDHHSVILKQHTRAGIERLAFKVEDQGDLEEFEEKLKRAGVKTEYVFEDVGQVKALRFRIPNGHTVELFHKMNKVGNGIPRVNPDQPWPKDIAWNKVSPLRIDHLGLPAADPPKTIALLTDVLGFHVSERVVGKDPQDMMAWLFAAPNSTHHVSIVGGPDAMLHHVAFAAGEWSDLRRQADILAMNRIEIEVGPTRHAISRQFTMYLHDPSGNRLELIIDNTRPDPDDEPITWTMDQMHRGVFLYEKGLPENFLSFT